MNKFILIAYKFPPYSDVGALRWTKLCKYLAHFGHEIHVFTVDWAPLEQKKWEEEINHPNIKIYRIPSGYPHKLKYRPIRSILLRVIRNRLLKILDYCFFYDDEAQHWGKHLIPSVSKLVEARKIHTIVVTGSPFQSFRWAAEIKKKHGCSLILDYRDPWTFDPYNNYAFFRKAKVKKWEQEVLLSADKVITVSHFWAKQLSELTSPEKIQVIENAFDRDDLPSEETTISTNENTISIVHLGSITNDRDIPLFTLLSEIKKHNQLKNKFRIKLIGKIGARTELKIKKSFSCLIKNQTLQLIPKLPQIEALKELQSADYALLLNTPKQLGALSTKIYEYIALKRFCLSLNYGGEIENFINNFKIGFSYNLSEQALTSLLFNIKKNPAEFPAIDLDQFSHKRKAEEFSKIINNIEH